MITRSKGHSNNATQVVQMIQRHQHIRQVYNEIKIKFGVRHKIIESGNTRFKTNVVISRSIMENKSVLRELVDTHYDIVRKCSAKPAIKNVFVELVSNQSFWTDLLIVLEFFEPIADILTKAESDTYYIEQVYKDMLIIFEHITKFN